MAQGQAVAYPRLFDRIQIFLDKRSVASIYGPCVFVILSAVYFYAAVAVSRRAEFWMDEVVAVQTAQLPSWRAIIDAIWGGQEMSPPAYHLFLHETLLLTRSWPVQLGARLPSIFAAFGAAIVAFVLMRRRVDVVISLFCFGLMLTMGLFPFAVQAKGYAFLVFFFSLSLLFWDNMEDSKHPALNGVGIWMALALCLSLHFYAIIEVATIALCEMLWIFTRKQWRLAVLAPLVCLIPVEMGWAPLARHLATFNAADTLSPNFYGKPNSGHFLRSVTVVLFGGDFGVTLLLAGGLLIAGLYYTRRLFGDSQTEPSTTRRVAAGLSRLEIMMIALALIPIVTFLFSVFVTKAYSERYITPVTLLAPMAAGALLGRLRDGRIVAVLLTPLLLFDLINKPRDSGGPYSGVLPTLQEYTRESTLPIVVDDGVFFSQILYAADPDMRARMVLLTAPDQAPARDPTNENMMIRGAKYIDFVHVAKLGDFLQTHPRFYLLTEMQTRAITIVPPLMKACALGPLLAVINGKFLFSAGLSYADQNCGKP